MNRLKKFTGLALLLGSATALHLEGLAFWTQAGSSGTPDESASGLVRFVQGEATLLPAVAAPSQATIRYNIVALDGLFGVLTPESYPDIGVRYRDNGRGAQVIVTVKSYDYTTGITNSLAVFDSDLYPSSAAYQTRTFGNCTGFNGYDFMAKAYFVEVQLVKSTPTGDPGVGILFASRYGVCRS